MSASPIKIGALARDWAEKSQMPCWYEPTASSTNAVAKETLLEPAPISLFVTEHQTAGRGRGGNTWQDQNSGSALLSSWVFQMSKPPQPVLSPAIGLAVYTALLATFPALPWSLKAPNDIFLGEKKCAGILLENVQQGPHHRLIVGIGLNIFAGPSEIPASSIHEFFSEGLTETVLFNIFDRLLLELSLGISQTRSELSLQQRQALVFALNQNLQKTEKVSAVGADGSLELASKKILWSDL